ncbi:MAG TPA: YegS/Rv2252/BmrU family lipid kinase [Terriglobales bacterium]|nr:YegS/Rv2252/BmrU family lipid kinase [Terriglobales bacterium]
MRKAILLHNPFSGPLRSRRAADVEVALNVLRSGGVDAYEEPTRAAGSAAEQAKEAIANGCDTVFACGGDGTVHDILQGLVGTEAALGVIPVGTANALAHDLNLPMNAEGAAQAALTSEPRRIAVGKLQYQHWGGDQRSCYFTVAAGIGVDAHLFYKLNATAKLHLGMGAYYARATQLWLTHRMENFGIRVGDNGQPRQAEVSQVLAVRIRYFGGMLRELAPGASLERNDLRLVLFHTRSRLAYLHYIFRGLFGARWKVPGIELVHSSKVVCQSITKDSGKSSRLYVEADGELLGTLPAEISVIPDALTILWPKSANA